MQSSLHRGICYPIIIPKQDLTLRQKIAGVHMQSPGLSVTQRIILRSFDQFQKVPAKSPGLENFNDEFSCLDPFWMMFLHKNPPNPDSKLGAETENQWTDTIKQKLSGRDFFWWNKPFLMVKGENLYLSRFFRIIHTWPSKDTPCRFAKRCVYLPLAMGVAGLTIPMGSLSAIRFLERYLENVSQCKASWMDTVRSC